jgi:uncharacterized protein (TIGR03663 family)
VTEASPPETAPAPAAPASVRLPPRVIAALVLFVVVALSTRFARLGARALHHDESIHAFMSYTLSKDGNWRYDPAYHGPFLYYANALVYKLVGASNTSARVLPAFFGLVLIAFAWPLRRWLGKSAAAFFAVLILLSPHMAYFSRFIREDVYSLVFTLATILAFQRYRETDRPRWLILAAAAFALAGITKENAYMTGVLFVLYGIWVLADKAWSGTPRAAAARQAATAASAWIRERFSLLLSAGLVFLFIWALAYTAFGRYPGDWLAIPKAVKYWMGQHAIARIAGPWWYYFPQLLQYDTAILFLLPFAFSKSQWKSDPLLRFGALLMPLLFLLAAGEVSGLFHPVSPGRWIALGTLLCLIGAYGPKQKEQAPVDPFLRFWAYWAIASFLIYAWAREKVPWLTVHPLLPLTILASLGAANLWSRRSEPRSRLALAAGALLLAVNAHALYLSCFRYGAHDVERQPNHAEMMAYVQTSEDIVRALGAVDRARDRVPGGDALITVTGEASWPLTWYLRDTPTKWTSRVEDATTPILVVDWDPEGAIEKQLREHYDARRVPIRAWWFPDVVPGSGPNAVTRPTLSDVLRLWLFHEIWSPIGSQDATFLVRKDIGGTGPLAPVNVHIQDTTSREYAGPADMIASARAFGSTGPDPGSFNEPRGLAADAAGNLYVADTKNHRIQVFDPAGRLLRGFGTKGTGEGQLNEPCGVAVDPQGDVWVADTWNARIAHFSGDGAWRGTITDPEKQLFGPRAIAVSRGVLYVADTGNKRIVRFDRDGRKLSDWGSSGVGPGQFVEPVGLAADAAGNIYVADTGNHRIQVFDGDGKFVRQFPIFGWKDFYTEPYIALGPAGSIFVTDSSLGRVCVYDAQGALKRTWKPTEPFKAPTGIAVDAFGTVTVSDRGMDRLFAWSLAGLLK